MLFKSGLPLATDAFLTQIMSRFFLNKQQTIDPYLPRTMNGYNTVVFTAVNVCSKRSSFFEIFLSL